MLGGTAWSNFVFHSVWQSFRFVPTLYARGTREVQHLNPYDFEDISWSVITSTCFWPGQNSLSYITYFSFVIINHGIFLDRHFVLCISAYLLFLCETFLSHKREITLVHYLFTESLIVLCECAGAHVSVLASQQKKTYSASSFWLFCSLMWLHFHFGNAWFVHLNQPAAKH